MDRTDIRRWGHAILPRADGVAGRVYGFWRHGPRSFLMLVSGRGATDGKRTRRVGRDAGGGLPARATRRVSPLWHDEFGVADGLLAGCSCDCQGSPVGGDRSWHIWI